MKNLRQVFISSKNSTAEKKTSDRTSRSLKKSFFKQLRWVYGKVRPKKITPVAERKIDDENYSVGTTRDLLSIHYSPTYNKSTYENTADSGDGKKRIIIDDMKMKMDEDAIHVALENTMLIVIELSKDNKQLAKELTSMREKQSLFEHRFQAIQDSYAADISNKNAKYDQVVEQLKVLTEQVSKTNKDSATFAKLESNSKKYMDVELGRIQDRNRIMEQKMSNNNDLLLQITTRQQDDFNRFEQQLKTCMELGFKNLTDQVDYNINEKIEELQKTMDVLVTEKNELVQLNNKAYYTTAADINNLKLKLAVVERKCNRQNNVQKKQYKTDIKNMKNVMKKKINQAKNILQDNEKSIRSPNERTDRINRKYEKLKMRLYMIEKEMLHKSERSMQEMLIMSTACLRGGVNLSVPNVINENRDKPAFFSPTSKRTTSPEIRSASQTAHSVPLSPPPPPPPHPPAGPQAKQYERYSINDDLLNDMFKQLRKPGDEIRKIPRRTDMIIPPPAHLKPPQAPPLPEQPVTPEQPSAPQVTKSSDEVGPGSSPATRPSSPPVPPPLP